MSNTPPGAGQPPFQPGAPTPPNPQFPSYPGGPNPIQPGGPIPPAGTVPPHFLNQGTPGGPGPGGPAPSVTPVNAPGGKNRGLVVAVLIVGAVLGLALIGWFATRGTTSFESVQVGQCFASFEQFSGGNAPDRLDTVDCAEPHAVESYFVSEYESQEDLVATAEAIDGVYSGDAENTICEQEFNRFAGLEYAESLLGLWAGTSEQLSGDVRLTCYIGHYDETTLVTGTLEDAGF